MPIVPSAAIVNHAYANQYAVAQVNTNGGMYDLARAIVETAQEEQAPVILGAYEKNLAYRGFEWAGQIMRFFADRADVPVAIHLDHGSSVDVCVRAIDAGFSSVMVDGSHLPIDENIASTQRVVERARPAGISVEGEVGELQKLAADGSMGDVKNLSDPAEVARFSAESGADMLAVGIGNAHGFYKGTPNIRLDLLRELAAASKVPLVLHGTTGLEDDVVRQCIALGMAKVNLGTLIRTRYIEYTAEAIAAGDHQNHPWRVCQTVMTRIKEHVRHIIRLTESAGRAKELA
jgi:ketose-bisphosphate aldolase